MWECRWREAYQHMNRSARPFQWHVFARKVLADVQRLYNMTVRMPTKAQASEVSWSEEGGSDC